MTQTIQPPAVELLTLGPEVDGKIPCAMRLVAPADVDRVPTHFILLLDISESMLDNRKLENCKQCANLMLNFMTPQDTISLITFGETAALHLKRVPADEQHKDAIKTKITGIHADGCTNLSAGLGYVRQVCDGDTQKAGLLILTDGHANRGVSNATDLRAIVMDLKRAYTNLSVHCVAYGTDHNADLLRGIAEDNQGSYNIVNTIEDTAFAFGETLGGLMSCAYQNVCMEVPDGTVIQGPHTMIKEAGIQTLRMGDIYAGNKPVTLLNLPVGHVSVTIKGMSLPMLEPWTVIPEPKALEERDKDIELTRLRFDCTSLLEGVRQCSRGNPAAVSSLKDRLADFETKVNDVFFNGHPVAELLRSEVGVMRSLLNAAERGIYEVSAAAVATQHMTSLTMARGFSSPMGAHRGGHHGRRGSGHAGPEDPVAPVAPVLAATSSCFQNRVQNQIASLMATASQTAYTEEINNNHIVPPNLPSSAPIHNALRSATLGPS